MQIVSQLYTWTDLILFYGLAVLRLWAIVDCATRKTAAFPAADKLTKIAWLAILLVAGAVGQFGGPPAYPFSLISAVIAAVYLADVRPAVREISGNS